MRVRAKQLARSAFELRESGWIRGVYSGGLGGMPVWMSKPRRSLFLRGMWKLLRDHSSAADLGKRTGEVVQFFGCDSPLLRRSQGSASDVGSSSHPAGCSPFCSDVVALEVDDCSQLSGHEPSGCVASRSNFLSSLRLQAIF